MLWVGISIGNFNSSHDILLKKIDERLTTYLFMKNMFFLIKARNIADMDDNKRYNITVLVLRDI